MKGLKGIHPEHFVHISSFLVLFGRSGLTLRLITAVNYHSKSAPYSIKVGHCLWSSTVIQLSPAGPCSGPHPGNSL